MARDPSNIRKPPLYWHLIWSFRTTFFFFSFFFHTFTTKRRKYQIRQARSFKSLLLRNEELFVLRWRSKINGNHERNIGLFIGASVVCCWQQQRRKEAAFWLCNTRTKNIVWFSNCLVTHSTEMNPPPPHASTHFLLGRKRNEGECVLTPSTMDVICRDHKPNRSNWLDSNVMPHSGSVLVFFPLRHFHPPIVVENKMHAAVQLQSPFSGD